MWIMYNHTLYIEKEYAEEVLKGIRKFYNNTYKKDTERLYQDV